MSSPLVLLDSEFRVASNYGVTGTPTWLLFDGGGNQLARGSRINADLQQAVDAAAG